MRSAARALYAQHAYRIAIGLPRIVAQRILTDQSRTNVHTDMRSGGEGWQWRSLGMHQLEPANPLRFVDLAGDPDRISVASGFSELAPKVGAQPGIELYGHGQTGDEQQQLIGQSADQTGVQ